MEELYPAQVLVWKRAKSKDGSRRSPAGTKQFSPGCQPRVHGAERDLAAPQGRHSSQQVALQTVVSPPRGLISFYLAQVHLWWVNSRTYPSFQRRLESRSFVGFVAAFWLFAGSESCATGLFWIPAYAGMTVPMCHSCTPTLFEHEPYIWLSSQGSAALHPGLSCCALRAFFPTWKSCPVSIFLGPDLEILPRCQIF